MRDLSTEEAVLVAGSGWNDSSCLNGYMGGALAGIIAGIPSGPMGMLYGGVGGLIGGAIAGGCFDASMGPFFPGQYGQW